MSTLKDLKAGDKVILTKRSGEREIREVRAVEGNLIDVALLYRVPYNFDRETGEVFRGGGERIVCATAADLYEVERENAERKRLAKEAEARRLADPKPPLVSRFKFGDFEPWEKLSLEQLEQIRVWLDAVQ